MKWTDRKEAPKWMLKMAPAKGGTSLPTRIEMLAISIVGIAGYYAWFVDPGSWLVRNGEETKTSISDLTSDDENENPS